MKFSIIIPIYNAEKYIDECLNSLLQQTNQDFEIVLVNDGSKDASGEICNKYASQYQNKVRVIHQENQGQLLTRCNGIEIAKGEYIVFLDVDDAIVPNGLEILSDVISKYNNPDMIIYSFVYDELLGNKRKAKLLFPEESVFVGGEQKKELYQKFFTTTLLNNVWTKAVKKTVFQGEFPNYQKYKKLRCSEDRLHSMGLISNAEKIVYIKNPLYEYRLVSNSVSRMISIDAIEKFNVRVLYEVELEYLNKWGVELSQYKERLDANWILQVLYVQDMFYKNMKNKELKKQVLQYPWTEFVPEELLCNYEDNPYLSDTQKECWKWIIDENYSRLDFYFFKKAFFKKLREVKRKIIGRK